MVPSEKYAILLRWAGLYEDQELYSQMESKLLLVVADDRWNKGEQLAIQVERNYVDKGLDHVLALYRFDSGFATDGPLPARAGSITARDGTRRPYATSCTPSCCR